MLAYETPACANGARAYAEKLAVYINDAQTIHFATRRHYGPHNIPTRQSIQNMIELRKARDVRRAGRGE